MILSPILTLDPAKVDRDLRFLMDCFREVVLEAGDVQLAQCLPWGEAASDAQDILPVEPLSQAYSIAFHLLSLVEQNAAVQHQRATEAEHGMAAMQALWGQCLQQMVEGGLTPREIAEALPQMQLDLVLTAHPTEAKRSIVLAHYRHLYLLLVKRENQMWTPLEQEAIREEVKTALALLWRTGEIYLEKPDVAAERRNIVHYLHTVFPDTLPVLDRRLRQTWTALGFPGAAVESPHMLPTLRLSTWVGGDRDGHPLVTADVTRQTFDDLRLHALLLIKRALAELTRQTSLSDTRLTPPPALRRRIDALTARLGARGRALVAQAPNESWHQLAALMLACLPLEAVYPEGGRLRFDQEGYARAEELLGDLQLLYDSLMAVGAERLAREAVAPVLRLAGTVGFHLATLDIRQNSVFHDRALAQLLRAAGFPEWAYDTWSEERRLALLDRELASPRPFLRAGASAGPEADATIAAYVVLAEQMRRCGLDGVGALIVSMTRTPSDLLGPYLFAREAGLMVETSDGPACPVQIVPLFETIDDLERSASVLQAFLSHPMTERSLRLQSSRVPEGELVQQVTIGYSDSNKDGGIFASLWSLYRAEAAMTAAGRTCGVRVRFLHGRGGTMSRGGGPEHRFVKAIHPSALNGDLRLTEQGETIAQKYANRLTAVYNLELLFAGLTRATLLARRHPDASHALDATMDWLSARSHLTYRHLLDTDGFLTFFREATPIDAIEESRIGSRPSRRTGHASFADLRAIPWVFSWSQSRFYLSAWYGLGSALAALHTERPEAFAQLSSHLLGWAPLHYVLSNAATCVEAADVDIMWDYAQLVEDATLRDRIWRAIVEELARTKRELDVIYGGRLAARRPNIHSSLARRWQALRVLHRQQIAVLREWRALRRTGRQQEAAERLPHLLLTVNAIASGLGTTG